MECLWNNKNIVYQKQVLYFQNWAQQGFTYINDLLGNNVILSFESAHAILGNSPSLFLEYVTIY
jgi:hypothetical protein